MKFLYGDSTPSPLKSNYLFFIRDAIEFCVHVIVAQERIDVLRKELRGAEAYADAERARIAGLRALVIEAAETANTDGPESMSKRAVDRVIDSSKQSIATTVAELEAKLAADRAAIAAKDREERDGCLDAFGKYIALHQAHEGEWMLSAKLEDSGLYAAQTTGRAPWGAVWKCALELAPTHPMAKAAHVSDFVTHVEISLPDANAWQKRSPKLREQRIDGFYIEEVITNGENTGIAIRTAPRGPFGVDVEFRGNEVTATAAGARDPFDVELDEDARQRFLKLRNKLVDALTTHAGVRRRVVTATLDEAPLADGEDLSAVATRVIDGAAPVIQAIRAHSLSPRELVIRRLLDDNERVEIFVSTQELLDKLGRVPRAKRAMFEPLNLEWQRARTPVPGEIYVEPPRELAERPVTESPRESAPETTAPAVPEPVADESKPDAIPREEDRPLRDSQPLPLPASVSQVIPLADIHPASPASSIDAALHQASVVVDPSLTEPKRPLPAAIEINARDRQALAATVKRIIGVARDGGTQLAFQAYAALFQDEDFVKQRAQDQRQVLKLMVMAKSVPPSSEPVLRAYRCALARLEALAEDTKDPADHEMIGVCMRVLASLEAVS